MRHPRVHVAPFLRRTYWLAGAAITAVALSASLTYEANRRDDAAIVAASARMRLGRDIQILALDREHRLETAALGPDSPAQSEDVRDRRSLFAKLDTLASIEASSPEEDSVVRDIKEELKIWDAAFAAGSSPVAGADSASIARGTSLFRDIRDRFDDLRRDADAGFATATSRGRWLRVTRIGSVLLEIILILAGLFLVHRQMLQQMSLVVESQHEVLDRLAAAGEYRDDDTGRHTQRVGELAARIALAMGFSADRSETIRRAAALHDVGKIGVPDSILLKRGKLTEEELDVVRQHTLIGARILEGGHSPMVAVAARVARSHHEWWDGSGYPDRLAGNEIPVEARITAVADVFDAVRSKRPYRDAFALEVCLEEIRRGAGVHFDPNVVQAFFKSCCYEGYAVEGGESQDAEATALVPQLLDKASTDSGQSRKRPQKYASL
jgi:HD-GYP domain-containing protein (c-di-GMP phosphodiesterase class II)